MRIGRPKIPHISILDPILPTMKQSTLWPRTGKYGIHTDLVNTFLNSQCPYLPFDITIALVQMRYHEDW